MFDSAVARAVVPRSRSSAAAGQTLAVLIAEDDPADALLTAELVADSLPVSRVECVATAHEAANAIAEGWVDCLVLDLHLPDLPGIGALDAWLPSLDSTAVVVMTGLDDRAAGLVAVRAGAQDYLVKGQVEPEWFGRAIRYAVQRKHAERTAVALRAARWRAAENVRLERGLLPKPLLRDAPVLVTTRCLPHREGALLGGDYFDVVETEQGVVHALIGDVSGHGPDEAALGAALRVAWRTLVLAGLGGPPLLEQLERVLDAERGPGEMYTTLATLVWRPGEPYAQLISAGHPSVLTRLRGEVTLQEGPHGPALGIAPGLAHWPVVHVPMSSGIEIIMYTDGLYENRDEHGRILGQERMVRSANALAHLADGQFVDALISATRDRTDRGNRDDVAVLHLRHLPDGALRNEPQEKAHR